ncbi:MAG: hypothetical protein ACRCVG_02100 [Methanobacteriaceae archaeon]
MFTQKMPKSTNNSNNTKITNEKEYSTVINSLKIEDKNLRTDMNLKK